MVVTLGLSLSLLLFCSTSLVSVKATCSEGWYLFESSCLYISQESGTWLDGYRSCINKGASLATVADEDENYFLAGLMSSHNAASVWIGLNDQDVEGDFKWIDGRNKTFLNFNYAEMKAGEHAKEKCFQIRQDRQYKWLDEYCELKQRYVCYKAADESS